MYLSILDGFSFFFVPKLGIIISRFHTKIYATARSKLILIYSKDMEDILFCGFAGFFVVVVMQDLSRDLPL